MSKRKFYDWIELGRLSKRQIPKKEKEEDNYIRGEVCF